MLDLRNVSIKARLQIIVISLFVVIFTTFAVTTYIEEKKVIGKIEEERLKELGYKYSSNIKSQMENSLSISKSIAYTIQGMKTGGGVDRKVVTDEWKKILEENGQCTC